MRTLCTNGLKSVLLELATVPVGPPATVTTSAVFEPRPE